MTDRELLELAAKAAGLEMAWTEHNGRDVCLWTRSAHDEGKTYFHANWSPLKDDGDALRLALTLDMSVDIDKHEDSTYVYAGPSPRVYAWEMWRDDKAAATRRAIVRAAAEIGKAMQ